MKILSGDIGGTKTLLQIADMTDGQLHIRHAVRFASNAWTGITPLVEQFLINSDFLPEIACFAIAGPVDGHRAQLTNLPWTDVDADSLARYFGIKQIIFLNDFQAIGYGIDGLAESELAILQAGNAIHGAPRALLGAGTGLGQSILLWRNGRYFPLESEGGHVDFAPTNLEQERLWEFLHERFSHVSYERILSGAGLVAIDHFLRGSLFHESNEKDLAMEISTAALTARDPIAVRSLRLFVQIYGQQAGNLALTCLARGGVYLAGGIAPRIFPFLIDGEFIRAFRAKGRMERLLIEMPVRVILNPEIGLIGATRFAIQENNLP